MKKQTIRMLGFAVCLGLATNLSASDGDNPYEGLEFTSSARGMLHGKEEVVGVKVWVSGPRLSFYQTGGLFDGQTLVPAVSVTEEVDRDSYALVRLSDAIEAGATRGVMTVEGDTPSHLAAIPCVVVETALNDAPGRLLLAGDGPDGHVALATVSLASLIEEKVYGFSKPAPVAPDSREAMIL